MGNEATNEFLTPVGPSASATASASRIFNIALVAATSAANDLTGANFTGLATAINAGRMVTLIANVDTWYRWSAATGTVDKTKTAASTPANQGVFLQAGRERRERPPLGTTFLIAQSDTLNGVLCIAISSVGITSELSL